MTLELFISINNKFQVKCQRSFLRWTVTILRVVCTQHNIKMSRKAKSRNFGEEMRHRVNKMEQGKRNIFCLKTCFYWTLGRTKQIEFYILFCTFKFIAEFTCWKMVLWSNKTSKLWEHSELFNYNFLLTLKKCWHDLETWLTGAIEVP